MKKYLLLFFCGYTSLITAFSQKKQAASNLTKVETAIIEEGRNLYQLEMASTLGLEAFLKQPGDLVNGAAGYFAYKENRLYRCVFFDRKGEPGILATICFDSTFNRQRIAVSTTLRPMNEVEKDIYSIRDHALDQIKRDTAFFKMYENTTMSILPVIDHGVKRVYILTKSAHPSVVIFGNDYMLEFDKTNYVSYRKELHDSMVSIECFKPGTNIEELSSITHKHHGADDLITPTDVCVLLLNEKKANWMHHVVKGKQYVSVWYCDTDELETMPLKTWKKHNKEDNDVEEDNKSKDTKNVAKPMASNK